jgi:hypothetical protein
MKALKKNAHAPKSARKNVKKESQIIASVRSVIVKKPLNVTEWKFIK